MSTVNAELLAALRTLVSYSECSVNSAPMWDAARAALVRADDQIGSATPVTQEPAEPAQDQTLDPPQLLPHGETWQTIETAPKDGTVVVLCSWSLFAVKTRQFDIARWNGYDWVIPRSTGATVEDPTHWMALPDLPKETP